MKLKKKKSYPIKDSPFYLLKGKNRLEKILGIRFVQLEKLAAASKNYYRQFVITNQRQIQEPLGLMKIVHKRISDLLKRIEVPKYIIAPRVGHSYIDNAAVHLNSESLIKTDISKFYPSTNYQKVYEMFVSEFYCAKDIAAVLAKICCIDQKFLPTGSSLSGFVAMLSAKKMFDEIERLISDKKCVMSVYVDDITISGSDATKSLLWEIRKIIYKHGYSASNKKSRFYCSIKPKTVTGVIVRGSKLFVPNRRHKKIHDVLQEYAISSEQTIKLQLLNRYEAMTREANKIITFRLL